MRRLILLALAIVALAVVAAGCGEDEKQSAAGNETDRAFASDMVPHHEGAIEMAELALRRAEHPEVKRLASSIIRAQRAEIAVLRVIAAELQQADVPVGDLGHEEHDLTMAGDVHTLEATDRFDRTFIEMMVPHHESAVLMAEVEQRSGQNPRLRRMANEIIDAQRREIAQMKGWFVKWFGEELSGMRDGHAG